MWHYYSFKAESSPTLVPLIKLEQKQNYIHWFSLNEKDFRVTGEDKSSFWALPKIPTPWLFWETQRGLILCLSCCQMRMAILHLYLFPTAFEQFFTGKINGLFTFRQFKVAWRTSLWNSQRLWVLFAEEMNGLSKCHESAFTVFSLSDCGFDQTVYSFSTHIMRPACKIELLNHLRILLFEFGVL